MHFKVYLSDEGFGHIVRQRAIVEVLREKVQPLELTLQTQAHIEAAGNYIPGANLIKRFNNTLNNPADLLNRSAMTFPMMPY